MQTTTLIGAEDVRAAGRNIQDAATNITNAGSWMQQALTNHEQKMEELVSRFEASVDRLVDALPQKISEDSPGATDEVKRTISSMDFSRAIKICRAVFRLKQTELAKRAGIDPGYLSLLESGRRNPSMTMVQKLAEAFDIPVDLFVLLAMADIDHDSDQSDRMAKAMVELLAAANREK